MATSALGVRLGWDGRLLVEEGTESPGKAAERKKSISTERWGRHGRRQWEGSQSQEHQSKKYVLGALLGNPRSR